MPEFVPVSDVVSADEGGYLWSLQEPLPPQAVTPTIAPMVAVLTPPTVPLNSCETVTAPVTKGSPSSAECVATNDVGPDLSREGPFDACDANHEPYDGIHGGARVGSSTRPDARILAGTYGSGTNSAGSASLAP